MTKTEFLEKCISFSVKINNLRKYLRELAHSLTRQPVNSLTQ